ncbi:hypothetical protein [Terrabacter sp. RAF57]|uniref:hypothetical protein n=1 Tax=Terrabacter sp. RAF57 TaxID=3233063 RepID=UPI003F94F6CD
MADIAVPEVRLGSTDTEVLRRVQQAWHQLITAARLQRADRLEKKVNWLITVDGVGVCGAPVAR